MKVPALSAAPGPSAMEWKEGGGANLEAATMAGIARRALSSELHVTTTASSGSGSGSGFGVGSGQRTPWSDVRTTSSGTEGDCPTEETGLGLPVHNLQRRASKSPSRSVFSSASRFSKFMAVGSVEESSYFPTTATNPALSRQHMLEAVRGDCEAVQDDDSASSSDDRESEPQICRDRNLTVRRSLPLMRLSDPNLTKLPSQPFSAAYATGWTPPLLFHQPPVKEQLLREGLLPQPLPTDGNSGIADTAEAQTPERLLNAAPAWSAAAKKKSSGSLPHALRPTSEPASHLTSIKPTETGPEAKLKKSSPTTIPTTTPTTVPTTAPRSVPYEATSTPPGLATRQAFAQPCDSHQGLVQKCIDFLVEAQQMLGQFEGQAALFMPRKFLPVANRWRNIDVTLPVCIPHGPMKADGRTYIFAKDHPSAIFDHRWLDQILHDAEQREMRGEGSRGEGTKLFGLAGKYECVPVSMHRARVAVIHKCPEFLQPLIVYLFRALFGGFSGRCLSKRPLRVRCHKVTRCSVKQISHGNIPVCEERVEAFMEPESEDEVALLAMSRQLTEFSTFVNKSLRPLVAQWYVRTNRILSAHTTQTIHNQGRNFEQPSVGPSSGGLNASAVAGAGLGGGGEGLVGPGVVGPGGDWAKTIPKELMNFKTGAVGMEFRWSPSRHMKVLLARRKTSRIFSLLTYQLPEPPLLEINECRLEQDSKQQDESDPLIFDKTKRHIPTRKILHNTALNLDARVPLAPLSTTTLPHFQ